MFLFFISLHHNLKSIVMNKNVCLSKGCPYLVKKTLYFPLYEKRYICMKHGMVDVSKVVGCEK